MSGSSRNQRARRVRENAAELAQSRPHPKHLSNGDELRYRASAKFRSGCAKNEPSYIAAFTKGLPHDVKTGLLLNPPDFRQFVLGIQSGEPEDFVRTPLGPAEPVGTCGCLTRPHIDCATKSRTKFWKSKIAKEVGDDGDEIATLRAWESQAAGLIYDLQGPDAQAVTMPPAPALVSAEMAAEMAEVYLMALLRDTHFAGFRDDKFVARGRLPRYPVCECECPPSGLNAEDAAQLLAMVALGGANWFEADRATLSAFERRRHRSLESLVPQRIFRGVAPGDDIGPYLSQFLLIGNSGINGAKQSNDRNPDDGVISFGAIRIDQRVRMAQPCKDYMTTFEAWLDVQNAANVAKLETYVDSTYRFITTPRDLATYVHYDALHEAYLNACLILLGLGAPFDPGMPFLQADVSDHQQGFASFGGPHILSLLPEVATRALKAVRFQKFNIHRRPRPEAVAGLIDRYKNGVESDGELACIKPLVEALDSCGLLEHVRKHNACQNATWSDRSTDPGAKKDSYLLPMAFPEGSPMHPSYGAGHATVAGACVTILKAFFDAGWELPFTNDKGGHIAYEPDAHGKCLKELALPKPLTVEGELNKLAANISIGRDWAGVHFFTDYIESITMGEQIALGILEEQKLTYGENFTMTIPLFDGTTTRI